MTKKSHTSSPPSQHPTPIHTPRYVDTMKRPVAVLNSLFRLAIFTCISLLSAACMCQNNPADQVGSGDTQVEAPISTPIHYVDVESFDSLTVYSPLFDSIELAVGTMPAATDSSVIFCCAAAFTAQLLNEFSHKNIVGSHVCAGTLYNNGIGASLYGAFVWSKQGGWKFVSHNDITAELERTAANGGMGFCQNLFIHNATPCQSIFRDASVNRYRALCEIDGRLCIIDCSVRMPFISFKNALLAIGVSEAIYCDMGAGWNYSWYRMDDGSVKELFPTPGHYTTNWITFRKVIPKGC